MPRPRNTVPRFCIDATGRAFTKVGGKFYSLGRADDPKSRERYAAVITEDAQGKLQKPSQAPQQTVNGVTVNELLLQYVTRELPRFSDAEKFCQRGAIRFVRTLFGETLAADFGPLKLRLVRDAMIDHRTKRGEPLSRGFINRQIKRVRSFFRWAVSWELIPAQIVEALATVPSLESGQSAAPDSTPREAVSLESIKAVRSHLKPMHRDIFDLLLLTGARPGEITTLTWGSIDRSSSPWIAELKAHKTARFGKRRFLVFLPEAQSILLRHQSDDPEESIFPIRRDYFSQVVGKACEKAKIGRGFTPHFLRHTAATAVVDSDGLETASGLLGHSDTAMTVHYSRAAIEPAIRGAASLAKHFATISEAK